MSTEPGQVRTDADDRCDSVEVSDLAGVAPKIALRNRPRLIVIGMPRAQSRKHLARESGTVAGLRRHRSFSSMVATRVSGVLVRRRFCSARRAPAGAPIWKAISVSSRCVKTALRAVNVDENRLWAGASIMKRLSRSPHDCLTDAITIRFRNLRML